MGESVIKTLDEQGRVSIPADWRRKWRTGKIVLTHRGDRVEIQSLESEPFSAFFDSITVEDDADFTDPESLRKALAEKPR